MKEDKRLWRLTRKERGHIWVRLELMIFYWRLERLLLQRAAYKKMSRSWKTLRSYVSQKLLLKPSRPRDASAGSAVSIPPDMTRRMVLDVLGPPLLSFPIFDLHLLAQAHRYISFISNVRARLCSQKTSRNLSPLCTGSPRCNFVKLGNISA